jgi:hypothetical protein
MAIPGKEKIWRFECVESYSVLEDIVVISGKDYVINDEYCIEGKHKIFVAPENWTVLEEVEEQTLRVYE